MGGWRSGTVATSTREEGPEIFPDPLSPETPATSLPAPPAKEWEIFHTPLITVAGPPTSQWRFMGGWLAGTIGRPLRITPEIFPELLSVAITAPPALASAA